MATTRWSSVVGETSSYAVGFSTSRISSSGQGGASSSCRSRAVPATSETHCGGLARAEAVGWITDLRLTSSPGDEVAAALSDHGLGSGRIGLVGAGDAGSWQHVDALHKAAAHASFEDATDLFEAIRGVKSDEEIEGLRETSTILRPSSARSRRRSVLGCPSATFSPRHIACAVSTAASMGSHSWGDRRSACSAREATSRSSRTTSS